MSAISFLYPREVFGFGEQRVSVDERRSQFFPLACGLIPTDALAVRLSGTPVCYQIHRQSLTVAGTIVQSMRTNKIRSHEQGYSSGHHCDCTKAHIGDLKDSELIRSTLNTWTKSFRSRLNALPDFRTESRLSTTNWSKQF
jgi:hypothetical protein